MKFKKTRIFLFFIIFLIVFQASIYSDDVVSEQNYAIDDIYSTIEVSTNHEEVPQINARHAIVLDRNSLMPLYCKNEQERCKMASTTKIMTAIITIELCDLNQTVTISQKSALTGGSRLGLSKNDKITVENLLYGLMLCSGNDCAVALAEHIAGNTENFAIEMNKKANELNLANTNFVTPHGLDNNEHYTTAYDLAILTDYALKNEFFSKIVKTKSYTVFINNATKNIQNTNELLGNYEGIYGVKTGFTNGANRCLVSVCKKNDIDVICVVLGCDTKKDRTKDSISLLNYIYNNFTLVNIQDILYKKFDEWNKIHKNSFFINKGVSSTFDLFLDQTQVKYTYVVIKKNHLDKINFSISFASYFEAPVYEYTKIGTIALYLDNTILYEVNILNNNSINKKNIQNYLSYFCKNYFSFF